MIMYYKYLMENKKIKDDYSISSTVQVYREKLYRRITKFLKFN